MLETYYIDCIQLIENDMQILREKLEAKQLELEEHEEKLNDVRIKKVAKKCID